MTKLYPESFRFDGKPELNWWFYVYISRILYTAMCRTAANRHNSPMNRQRWRKFRLFYDSSFQGVNIYPVDHFMCKLIPFCFFWLRLNAYGDRRRSTLKKFGSTHWFWYNFKDIISDAKRRLIEKNINKGIYSLRSCAPVFRFPVMIPARGVVMVTEW